MESDSPAERDQFGFRLEWPADALLEPFEAEESEQVDDEVDDETEDTSLSPYAPGGSAPPSAAPTAAASTIAPPPPPRPTPPLAPRPKPVPATPAIALDDPVAGLAAVVARVEALSSTTVTFRNAIADQVTDYTHRVSQAMAEQAAEVDRAVRAQDHAVRDLGGQLGQLTADLGAVLAAVDGLVVGLAELRAEMQASLDGISDEVRTLRRRTAVKPRAGAGDEDRPAPARRQPRRG